MDTSFFLRESRESVIYRPLALYYLKPSPRFRALVYESVFHGVLDDVTFRDPILINCLLHNIKDNIVKRDAILSVPDNSKRVTGLVLTDTLIQ